MTLEEFLTDCDWGYAFQYCGPAESSSYVAYGEPCVSAALGSSAKPLPFQRKDVAEIIASRDGENNGPDWLGIFALRDGRYAFVSAGCNYTGWSCRASGYAIVSHDLAHLVQYGLGDADRAALGL